MTKQTPYLTLILICFTSLTGGCQTVTETKNMSSGGVAAFSCEQIQTAFAAYDSDRQSFQALAELSGMTGFDFTQTATQSADAYYEKARNSANLALIIKGCPPLQ